MKVNLLLFFLIPVFLIAGCTTTTQTGQENDNALLMTIKPHQVRPSVKFDIKVPLVSQVEGTLKNVELRITNLDGLNLVGVSCVNGEPINNEYCRFREIEGFDIREAEFTLQAPSRAELGNVGTTKHPKFTLQYDYIGETTFNIPIVKTGVKTDVKPVYVEKTAPIKTRITKGTSLVAGEVEEVGIDVERPGSIFPIFLEFADALLQTNSNIMIEANRFTLTLSRFSVSREVGFERCDFNVNGQTLTLTKDVRIRDGEEFICSLRSDSNFAEDLVTGSIIANFDYTYTLEQEVPVEIIISLIR